MAETAECETKVWYKSKTVWLNIALALIWALSIAEGFTDDKLYVGILALASAVLNLVVRYLTGQPITLRDLQAIARKAQELQKEREVRSNPASMKSQPWPSPNMDGTPFEKTVVPMPPPEREEIAIIQKGLDNPKE